MQRLKSELQQPTSCDGKWSCGPLTFGCAEASGYGSRKEARQSQCPTTFMNSDTEPTTGWGSMLS
eukprot:scaffold661298_cov43-Prasinocladus_malaysianus.AAC.1